VSLINKVLVLYTGGTVGMSPLTIGANNGHLAPDSLASLRQHLLDSCKEVATSEGLDGGKLTIILDNGNCIELQFASLANIVDSSSITPSHWAEMAAVIEREYHNHDGFVVLHGTDSMAYSASALAFMMENLAKPVVLTGALVPVGKQNSDGRRNFISAVQVAAAQAAGLPLIPEVVIVFDKYVLRGCRARKMMANKQPVFDSPNFPVLGQIGSSITINSQYLLSQPDKRASFIARRKLSEHVLDFTFYPGCAETAQNILRWFCDRDLEGRNGTARGVLLRSFGVGNGPNDAGLLEAIRQAVENGTMIVNISQCPSAMVDMGLYASGKHLQDAGVLSGMDMTPEAALSKMMWILGSTHANERVRLMQANLRGEIGGEIATHGK